MKRAAAVAAALVAFAAQAALAPASGFPPGELLRLTCDPGERGVPTRAVSRRFDPARETAGLRLVLGCVEAPGGATVQVSARRFIRSEGDGRNHECFELAYRGGTGREGVAPCARLGGERSSGAAPLELAGGYPPAPGSPALVAGVAHRSVDRVYLRFSDALGGGYQRRARIVPVGPALARATALSRPLSIFVGVAPPAADACQGVVALGEGRRGEATPEASLDPREQERCDTWSHPERTLAAAVVSAMHAHTAKQP